jgi:hypothetical protein
MMRTVLCGGGKSTGRRIAEDEDGHQFPAGLEALGLFTRALTLHAQKCWRHFLEGGVMVFMDFPCSMSLRMMGTSKTSHWIEGFAVAC